MWFAVFEFGKASPRHRIPTVDNKKLWGEYNLTGSRISGGACTKTEMDAFLFSFYIVLPSYDSSSELY